MRHTLTPSTVASKYWRSAGSGAADGSPPSRLRLTAPLEVWILAKESSSELGSSDILKLHSTFAVSAYKETRLCILNATFNNGLI